MTADRGQRDGAGRSSTDRSGDDVQPSGDASPIGDDRSGIDDPTAIRSIAVSADDLVTALEANRRADRGAVLRITPPFAGRMRARLHVAGTEGEYGGVEPVHVDPEDLVTSAVPDYPDVDETADELLVDGDYSIEEHRERHAEAVARWREAVRANVADRMELDTGEGPHPVSVAVLG